MELIAKWIGPFLELVIAGLLAALLASVRKLPDWALRLAANMEVEAKKTPGAGDDAAAMFVGMLARALAAAFAQKGSPTVVVTSSAAPPSVVEATAKGITPIPTVTPGGQSRQVPPR